MRKQKFILVMLLFFAATNIFAQWTIIDRAAVMNSINKLSENKFLIFSTDSYLKSNDAGQSWSLPLPLINQMKGNVQFVDSLYGWAISPVYTSPTTNILKTTDGGNSWSVSSFPAEPNGFYFLDRNTGWVVGNGGTVAKTINGGINWTTITYSQLGNIPVISMKDQNTGYMVHFSSAVDSVMKTTNGGINWFKHLLVPNHHSIQIIFKDAMNGWSLGWSANIARTTDGGQSWTVIQTPMQGNYVRMFFLNLMSGWALDKHGQIWKTGNGGYNWINQRSTPNYDAGANLALHDILFKDENTGWATGERGRVLKTTDGGTTWNYMLNPPAPFVVSLKFMDVNTGYLLSKNTSDYSDSLLSTLWKTTNRGINWNKIKTFPANFTSMSIIDENNYYLCGEKGYNKTTNAGASWSSNVISVKTLVSINFLNQNTGWVCGDTSTILKTTNGGLNWVNVNFPLNFNLKKIEFKNELTGTVLTTSAYICTTTNGGTTWLTYTPGTDYKFADFNFVGTTGFCVANYYYMQQFPPYNYVWYRALSKTTNSGVTWINKLTETGVSRDDKNFYSVVFGDEQNGFIPHGQGMKTTTNGGDNWSDVSLPVITPMNIGYMVNASQGYFTAQDGSLFSTFPPTSITNISSQIPDVFTLHQNYPNPFNPSTKINYEIKSSGFVSMKVFDILGKEVATLVNQKQNAGSYAVDFNSAEFNLPSGIYFYTLNAGEFKETKKMVLVK